MEVQIIQFPAELVSYKTYATKDNVQVSFELQEALDANQIAKLLSGKGQTGWLVFSPSEKRVQITDIPELPVREAESKPPSVRLRAVLFLYHQFMKIQKPFDQFYDEQMEVYIDSVKRKLPPQE